MSLTYHEDNSVTIPAPKVVHPGMFSIMQGNKVLAQVDGVFDFTDVPEEHHEMLMTLITNRGMIVSVPPPETDEERQEQAESLAKVAAWKALPWWKRWITPHPLRQ